jgi:hypothetical protein
MGTQSNDSTRPATSIDIHRIFGYLDDARTTEILALKPRLADLEDAAICLAGEHDVVAKSGHHIPVTAARIVEMLAAKEEGPKR